MADDDRGGHGPAASVGEQLRAVRLDERGELGEELAFPAGDVADPSQQRFGDRQLRGVWQPRELARQARQTGADLRSFEGGGQQLRFDSLGRSDRTSPPPATPCVWRRSTTAPHGSRASTSKSTVSELFIEYRDLAMLVIAIERHAALIAEKNLDRQETRKPVTV